MARALRCLALALLLAGCADARTPYPVPSASSAHPAAKAALTTAPSVSSSAPAVAVTQPPPPQPPLSLTPGGARAVSGEAGLVTSVEANATKVGVGVLERGGNAIDAAVAVAYALAVTHPSAGNLGGGGFMVVRLADGTVTTIDFREIAPKTATTEKVLKEIDAGAIGWASVAVPGTVAGLELARERFGTVARSDLIAPAIRLARGHKLAPRAAQALAWQWEKLKLDPTASRIFGKGGKALAAGDRIVQKDLAQTLERIAEHGADDFYQGETARRIAASMKAHGADITPEDLGAYVPKERKALHFVYRGFEVDTMPPPSMGGLAIAETLLQLERVGAYEKPPTDPASIQIFVEMAKRAYADRRTLGADPDFYGASTPKDALVRLLSPESIAARTATFTPGKPTPPAVLDPTIDDATAAAKRPESPETTHFAVVDAMGNAVSCTVTLSASFGAKVIPEKTGVLFSNALGGFSASGPNEVAPHKRMASSMSPTILSRDGKVVLVIGSPGGDTIPNTIAQVVRNVVDYGMTVDRAAELPRVHHQNVPDVLRVEKARALSKEVVSALGTMGYKVEAPPAPLGDVKLILVDGGAAWGYADTREGGLALGAKKRKTP
jgi:gamma-glutamyltranspeptidase / glutathione hydrolase